MTTPRHDYPDHWSLRARCSRVDPELFFPTNHCPDEARYAKAICGVCPVRLECLDDAMAYESGADGAMRFGILGGLDSRQRHALARTYPTTKRPAC